MTPLLLFGGSGDLARAKVLPALLRLRRDGVFPAGSPLVFAARRALDPASLLAEAAAVAPDAAGALASLVADARAVELPLGDESAAAAVAATLPEGAAAYAALPPSTLGGLIVTAGALSARGRLARLAVEKPLGRDGAEASALLAAARAALGGNFFLVDHYAWKPAFAAFRALAETGASGLPTIGDVSRLEIVAMRESKRVGRRAAFYDEVGAIRDVFQSHGLLFLGHTLAALAGVTFADALRSLSAASASRARYVGYEAEGGVAPDVETSARLSLRSSLAPRLGIVADFGKALPNPGAWVAVESAAGAWRLGVQPDAALVRADGSQLAFPPAGEGYDAYEGALAAVLSGDFSAAPSPEDAALAWRVADEARALAAASPLLRHEPGVEPAW
jgi:glucose-6-phosphate 1-dehydrogenase